MLRHIDLARLSAQGVNARIKRAITAARGIDGQCANDQCSFQYRLKTQERMKRQRR